MSHSIRSLSLAFFVNILVPVALIGGTFMLVRPFLMNKKRPVSQESAAQASAKAESVSVWTLQPIKARAKLQSTGVATPAQQMTLVPELSAKVTWVSKELQVGATVRKGQTLVRLDDKNYKLALRTQQNLIAKAKLDLEIEKERAQVAKRELALLERSKDLPASTNRDLATRTHHLEVAKVAVDAAKGGMEQAQIQLARTVIRAPFDAVVLSENVEKGQVVAPGKVIATLIGAHQLHVRATIPIAQLSRIIVNGPPEQRTQALVRLQGGPVNGPTWTAYADRLVHELDTKSLNAQVLFVVKDPFSTEEGKLPLLAKSLVKLEIQGTEEQEVYPIPRSALVQGNHIWTVDQQDRIHKIPLTIAWGEQDKVFAQSPKLRPGLRALTLAPRSGIEGAKVQVISLAAPKEGKAR